MLEREKVLRGEELNENKNGGSSVLKSNGLFCLTPPLLLYSIVRSDLENFLRSIKRSPRVPGNVLFLFAG